MGNKLTLAGLVFAAVSSAADPSTSGKWLGVQVPPDSPVLPVSFDISPTTATVSGSSLVLNLHASLILRNIGDKPICGLTLRVEAQDLTPYGKGSVIKPSLFILPHEEFPVRVDMQLLRPLTASHSESAIVQVTLDCALFSDLKAYGPDKLNSRRALVVYELQARRDRQFLAGLLNEGRTADVREELNFGIQEFLPHQLGLELLRGPGGLASALVAAVRVDPMPFSKAPIQPLRGHAQVAGNEVRASSVEMKNMSRSKVSSVGVGWIVRDDHGRDFVAGALTSTQPAGPSQIFSIREPGTLRFLRPTGQPMPINGLMTFVNDVEFGDGSIWIPSRSDIAEATPDPTLRRELGTSPEEQRLAQIYRREGTAGLKRELKRVSESSALH